MTEVSVQGGLGLVSAWHLPDGPVGPPARWVATSNVEERSGMEEEAQGPSPREGEGALLG